MSVFKDFKAWFSAGRETREMARSAGAEVPDEALFRVVEDEAYDARAEAQKTEVVKLEEARAAAVRERDLARQETIRAHAIRQQAEAAAFADGLVAGGKLFPAEREAMIAAFVQAAQDDAAHGAVTFSGGTQGSRVEQFKTLYEARPAHQLTKEGLDPSATFRVLPGGAEASGNGEDDPTQPTPEGKPIPVARMEYLRKSAGLKEKKA